MIREFNPGTNDFDVFFEQFETVVEAEIVSAQWKPENRFHGGIRFMTPPTVVRLPYGSLPLGVIGEDGDPRCAAYTHEYVRGLIWHEGKIWSCTVCRHCEHVAPPERGSVATGATPTLPDTES